MPNTRSSNQDANFKVYYSKKVPKQVYFPHRRKTVRRPDAPHHVPDKKQMTFRPDMIRRQDTVQDSEDSDLEGDGEVEVEKNLEEKTVEGGERTAKKKGKKRRSDAMQEHTEDDEEPLRPTPKRRRKGAVKTEGDDEPSPVPSEPEPEDTKRRRRRQSTMTQIVDGRRPPPGIKDPEFIPVRKSKRTSWGGKGSKEKHEKDGRQKTLTQMVPGLIPSGIVSDEDMEGDEEDEPSERGESQEYDNPFAQSLAEEGLLHPKDCNDAHAEVAREYEAVAQHVAERHRQLSNGSHEEDVSALSERVITRPANVHTEEEETNDEYFPTQNIDTSTMKKTRTSQRTSGRQNPSPVISKYTKSSISKPKKSRFGLLSTPEKRRVFEIPSSQSPSDSPISTQATPRRLGRSPLKPRLGNLSNPGQAETPSKRRKQVTFQEPDKEQIPPPTLRKFASVIQDSEDEDEAVSGDDDAVDGGCNIGAETQALIRRIDEPIPGADVGAETQAILHSIDRACANADEDAAWTNREPSEELCVPLIGQNDEESQELGERRHASNEQVEVPLVDDQLPQSLLTHFAIKQEPTDRGAFVEQHIQSLSAHPAIKQEPTEVAAFRERNISSSPPSHQTPRASRSDDVDAHCASATSPLPIDNLPPSTPSREQTHPKVHETPLSPPMILDSSSDEEDLAHSVPIPPYTAVTLSQPSRSPHTTDSQSIQVPRSPSPNPNQETQTSYSSKAEQQLHSEYQNYSQYRLHPPTSSIHVAPDQGFSYQATPFPPRPNPSTQPRQHSGHFSQATTVDPTQRSPSPRTTPRKQAKTQPTRSATTTPHKIPSSLPFVSPHRPPPLLIPSSFPSPGKVMAGWSSPVGGRDSPTAGRHGGGGGCGGKGAGESQWTGEASWEDFSIPAPPPALVISDDEEL